MIIKRFFYIVLIGIFFNINLNAVNFDPSEKYFLNYLLKSEYYWADKTPDISYKDFNTPAEMINAYKYSKIDKWSYTIDLFGEPNLNLIGFGLSLTDDAIVYKIDIGSPAYHSFFKRGDKIIEINKEAIFPDTFLNAESYLGKLSTFKILRNNKILIISLIPIDYRAVENDYKVGEWQLFSYKDKKIGHFILDSFSYTSSDSSLSVLSPSASESISEAFIFFKKQSIDELIIDLRYNTGGNLAVASILLDKLAGYGRDDELQFYTKWNKNHQDKNSNYYFNDDSTSIPLKRVIFLTSEQTASASEVVINALKPYIDVVTIGTTTHGKPVGMQGRRIDDIVYYLINFSVYNASHEGDYYEGLSPNCRIEDTIKYSRLDKKDNLLNEALNYIKIDACSGNGNNQLEDIVLTSGDDYLLDQMHLHKTIKDISPFHEYISNPIKIYNINKTVNISSNMAYIIKNGLDINTKSVEVSSGDIIQFKLDTLNEFDKTVDMIFYIGLSEYIMSFETITTLFSDKQYVEPLKFYISDKFNILENNTNISIDKGIIVKNNIELSEKSTICDVGDIIQIKLKSNKLKNSKVTANVTINNIIDTFSLITSDTIEDLVNSFHIVESNEKLYNLNIEEDLYIDFSFNFYNMFSFSNILTIFNENRDLVLNLRTDKKVFLKKGKYVIRLSSNEYDYSRVDFLSPKLFPNKVYTDFPSGSYELDDETRYYKLDLSYDSSLEIIGGQIHTYIYDDNMNTISYQTYGNKVLNLKKGQYFIKLKSNSGVNNTRFILDSVYKIDTFENLKNQVYFANDQLKYFKLELREDSYLDMNNGTTWITTDIYDINMNLVENEASFSRTIPLKKGIYVVRLMNRDYEYSVDYIKNEVKFYSPSLDTNDYEEYNSEKYTLKNEVKYIKLEMPSDGNVDINPDRMISVTIFDENYNLIRRSANLIRTVSLTQGKYLIKLSTTSSKSVDVEFFIPILQKKENLDEFPIGLTKFEEGAHYKSLSISSLSKITILTKDGIFDKEIKYKLNGFVPVKIYDEQMNLIPRLKNTFLLEEGKYIVKIIVEYLLNVQIDIDIILGNDDDNDGMSDDYELSHGLNPLIDDSKLDLDNDGKTNLEEFNDGTNPNDKNSKIFTINLTQGWNLISLPLNALVNISTLNNPNIEIIKTLQDSIWKNWIKDSSSNTLDTLEDGYGYWIKVSQNSSISILGDGLANIKIIKADDWNMLGSRNIEDIDAFFTNNPNIKILWKYKDGKYQAISNDSDISQDLSDKNIEVINEIKADEGFFVK